MAISPERTPNPNALKFTVGEAVGGPATYSVGSEPDDPTAGALLALPGVTSVFMTADFVTLSKSADGSWDDISPAAVEILEQRFG